MLMQSLQLMLYGLAGVFSALAILYITVRIINGVFVLKDEKKSEID